MKILSNFMDLLYPPKCCICRKLLPPNTRDLCLDCAKHVCADMTLEQHVEYAKWCVCVCRYEGEVRHSLQRFKFGGMRQYADCYGKLIANRLYLAPLNRLDFVTYVPVSRRRKRKRGYDQARELARAVAKYLGLPLVPTLQKWLNNPAQAKQDHSARKANVRGVYRTRKNAPIKDKHILLIDDIVTSGATLSEAASVLKIAGAAEVCCATFAAAGKIQKSR